MKSLTDICNIGTLYGNLWRISLAGVFAVGFVDSQSEQEK